MLDQTLFFFCFCSSFVFFFNDTATTEIYTLSLHDALPICYTGYKPLGVVAPGEEALQLFNDGFEKGDASAWNEEFAC